MRKLLTRIEIDGFKSFADFELDVPPFLAVVGPNTAGKSNLFDAMALLSHLADKDLRAAFSAVRGGQPRELFRRRGDGSIVDSMTLAAEVLLAPETKDPWGTVTATSNTRLRYELTLVRRATAKGMVRPFVEKESVRPVRRGADRWIKLVRPSRGFRAKHIRGSRSTPLLETSVDELGRPVFKVRQEGVQGRPLPAHAAEATVLSSMVGGQSPHLFALREEFRSWRFLQLDPAALRTPTSKESADRLQPDGGNLASVLRRIQTETASEHFPRGVLADVVSDLVRLIPGIVDIELEDDPVRNEWNVVVRTSDSAPYSARVASDGTLRVLALLAALHDPSGPGVVCLEEPENGIPPARFGEVISALRGLVTDPSAEDSDPFPLSQLIVSSHSPVILQGALSRRDIVMVDTVRRIEPEHGAASRCTRARRLQNEGEHLQQSMEEIGTVATEREIRDFADLSVKDALRLLDEA